MKYLLDTNVVSEPLRPAPDPGVLKRLRALEGEIAIPSSVWHELQFGCARLPKSKRKAAIARYLSDVVAPSFAIVAYDRAAAEWHGRERARLATRGKTPSFVDGQIAAIARVNELVLVTSNHRDFEPFEGVQLADWRAKGVRG